MALVRNTHVSSFHSQDQQTHRKRSERRTRVKRHRRGSKCSVLLGIQLLACFLSSSWMHSQKSALCISSILLGHTSLQPTHLSIHCVKLIGICSHKAKLATMCQPPQHRQLASPIRVTHQQSPSRRRSPERTQRAPSIAPSCDSTSYGLRIACELAVMHVR